MKRLEDMTIGQRVALTLVIVLVILFALAFIGWIGGGWDKADAQVPEIAFYEDVPLDMRLLQLDKRALDEAYHQQLLKLWSVWLAQGAPDPKYFQNGLSNARRAYNIAAKQISDRESVLFERERNR